VRFSGNHSARVKSFFRSGEYDKGRFILGLFNGILILQSVIKQRRLNRSRQSPATADRPTLAQFVILSMLLHMLAIALFGNTASGGARRGGVFWGQLDVTMQRLLPENGSGSTHDRSADAPSAALLRRSRGTKDAPLLAPALIEESPAARSSQTPEAKPIERPPAAAEFPQMPRDAAPSAHSPEEQLPSTETLPRLDPEAPDVVDRPLITPIAPPPAIEPQVAPPAEPARDARTVPAAALEPAAPPKNEREPALPAALLPRVEQIVPAAPIERIAPPKIERELAPPLELKARAATLAPSAPIEQIAAPKTERELAAPVEFKPGEVTAAPPAPAERNAPPKVEREVAPAAQPASSVQPGTPIAGEDILKPRRDVVPPASESGGIPRIDLDAVRRRAREIASEGSGPRRLLPFPALPQDGHKSKEAIAIEKALKPDCRTAYAELGLAAIVPLLGSAIGEGGCKW
jgi:hypothetical protein